MRLQVLGDLAVWDDDGVPVLVPGPSRRGLLAILLLHANEVVSADRLIDELWGERPPPTAAKSLQVHVWRLRAVLGGNDAGEGPLVTQGGGYMLRVGAGELDLEVFERLLAEGRAALASGQPQVASVVLGEALALWRGPPLGEFEEQPFARSAITRLDELRLEALEARIDADLALGRHRAVVAELESLIALNPLREHLRAQLMRALYRCGRQADALAVYRETRRLLSDELGLEPGAELRGLERSVLDQDPSLDLPAGNEREPPVSSFTRGGTVDTVPAEVDAKVATWRAWIEGPIRDDVLAMHHKRVIWRELNDMLAANPEVGEMPSAFWDFHHENYATAQAIWVRRQADRDPRTSSLARLVEEMRDDAERLTRGYFVSLWGDEADQVRARLAHSAFDALSGDVDDHLDPAVPQRDLEALRGDASKMRVFVNEHVAHDMATPTVAEMPTFEDMHTAIDSIGRIFKKYANVLTAGTYLRLEPVMQDDWKAIFRVAWLKQ